MKKTLFAILAALLLVAPGCAVLAPKSPVTWEASRFLAFKDVWATTLAMYDHAKDLQVAGKISARDAQDIDRAWNLFRSSFKLALENAGNNPNAFTPDEVRKLANDVLTLIYSAQ